MRPIDKDDKVIAFNSGVFRGYIPGTIIAVNKNTRLYLFRPDSPVEIWEDKRLMRTYHLLWLGRDQLRRPRD